MFVNAKVNANNPNLVWSTSIHMQNLVNFHQFVPMILSGNKILTITNSHNCIVYLHKLTRNNPSIDLVNINAYTKFDEI